MVVGRVVEDALIQGGAGGDDAHDLAADEALGLLGVLGLLGNGDASAEAHELGQIALESVVGHARHGHIAVGPGGLAGDGDLEQTAGLLGVLGIRLVEIPAAKEEERVRVLGLERRILAHHGRGIGRFEKLGGGHGAGGVSMRGGRSHLTGAGGGVKGQHFRGTGVAGCEYETEKSDFQHRDRRGRGGMNGVEEGGGGEGRVPSANGPLTISQLSVEL
jgi:hypothetical protein